MGSDGIANTYGIQAVPTICIIDINGVIRHGYVGSPGSTTLKSEIDALLTEEPQLIETQLIISPASFTLSPGDSITLTATLTSDGMPLAGKTIAWTITVGSVSPWSGTTDSQGRVTTTYRAPDYETNVTITASFAGDYDYPASSGNSSGSIGIAAEVEFPPWVIVAIVIVIVVCSVIGIVLFFLKRGIV